MEELVQDARDSDDLALLLEMPNGDVQRFPVNTDEEKQQLCAVLDGLPEETRQKHWDQAMAALDANPEKKAIPIPLPNGRVLVIF
ncbi:hypothetical protein [Massilia sp. CT11-137]|uniref:hypothetical protein n=1 Tax=Massilia sp. CT11-137 TaxID=3393901 RepID=UPI0039AF25C0